MGSAYEFMVNMSEIGRFGSPILFCIFMDGKELEMLCKIFEEFSKMASIG